MVYHRPLTAYANALKSVSTKVLDRAPRECADSSAWRHHSDLLGYDHDAACEHLDHPDFHDHARYKGSSIVLGTDPRSVRIMEPKEVIVHYWNGGEKPATMKPAGNTIRVYLDYKLREDGKPVMLSLESEDGAFTRGAIAYQIVKLLWLPCERQHVQQRRERLAQNMSAGHPRQCTQAKLRPQHFQQQCRADI
jgi:hypothetical protein